MRTGSVRRVIGAAIAVVLLSQVAAVLILNADVASAGASTAGFTSVNESVDGGGKCNNNSAVNCNNYTGKQFVWMNGGPSGACLDDGTYFFAVTTPSGGPNDGDVGLLSSDAQANRTFTMTGCVLTYSGLHTVDYSSNKIRLADFGDSPNSVYKMHICSVPAGVCKTDNFRVGPGGPAVLAGALSATKDANPAFTRAYHWGITKDVDKTLVKKVGGTATFNYTATVTRSAGGDSNFKITGTIIVTNDLAAGNANDVNVTDSPTLSPGTASCTVYDPINTSTPYVQGSIDMAAGDEFDFPYSCDLTGATAATTGSNSAHITWTNDPNTNPATGQTDTPPAAFDFSAATITPVNDCVTVTDTFNGGPPQTLTPAPTCTTPTAYQYSQTVNVPATGCVNYTNTATFTTDDTQATGSASKTVTVCGPIDTGALTMGFWHNKNGQKIITTGTSTAGVCNSGTWLRQFAPFQDLSASATCGQVAAYQLTIFNAASSAGAAMNAMLKSQMLATAFDVYFSDPALGGNKIGAPFPIGGLSIDLTMICANPTGCSTIINASGAFGGATSLTVSGILSYAASQSNAGGSVWYAQVKATQEKAKDTFDAINNDVAFS